MTLGVFARAAARVLDHLGEDSLLRGEPAGKVSIERNVTLSPGMLGTAEDNHVANADVATVLATYAPKTGDTLVHPDGTFKLDRKVAFNGHAYKFIVVKVS